MKETDNPSKVLQHAMSVGGNDPSIESLPISYTRNPLNSYYYIDKHGKRGIRLNKHHTPINSHEFGHAIDYSNNNKSLYNNILSATVNPTFAPLNSLLAEYNANRKSWKALKKYYKDRPDILNELGDLRSEFLVPAYKTYAYANTPALALGTLGSVAGGLAGYNHLNNKYLGTYLGQYLGGYTGVASGNAISNNIIIPDIEKKLHQELLNKINDKDLNNRIYNLNKKLYDMN